MGEIASDKGCRLLVIQQLHCDSSSILLATSSWDTLYLQDLSLVSLFKLHASPVFFPFTFCLHLTTFSPFLPLLRPPPPSREAANKLCCIPFLLLPRNVDDTYTAISHSFIIKNAVAATLNIFFLYYCKDLQRCSRILIYFTLSVNFDLYVYI